MRRAILEDANQIAFVNFSSWQTTYRGIVSDKFLDHMTPEQRIARWEKALSQNSIVYVVVNDLGDIVGFACGGDDRTGNFPEYGELQAIYLIKEAQGNGIGTKLATVVLREMKKKGFSKVLVWVLADNPARRFYETLGATYFKTGTIQIGEQILEEICYIWKDLSKF